MKSGYQDHFKKVKGMAIGKSERPKRSRDFPLSNEEIVLNFSKKFGTTSQQNSQSESHSDSQPHSSFNSQFAALSKSNIQFGKAKNRKKKSRVKTIIFGVFGLVLSSLLLLNTEQLDRLLRNVDVSFFGKALAEVASEANNGKNSGGATTPANSHSGGAFTSESKGEEKDKNSIQSSGSGENSESKEKNSNAGKFGDDLDHLARLSERKKELDRREEDLNRLEVSYKKQEEEIGKRMDELERVRRNISSILEDRVKLDESKVENLMQTTSNMKPIQAAKILEAMDEDLAVEILGRMKKKNAAEIMNLIKADKGKTLFEKYAGYKKK